MYIRILVTTAVVKSFSVTLFSFAISRDEIIIFNERSWYNEKIEHFTNLRVEALLSA